MSKYLPLHRHSRALLALLALNPLISGHAQLPNGSGLRITTGPVINSANLTIADPGNNTWILQRSRDLTHWTDLETLKVHNGRFQRKVSTGGFETPRVYYFRTVYDSSKQTLTSTLTNGLLLPGTPDNYAQPALPPSFLTGTMPAQDTTPQSNPVTDAAATLGRVLFYDKRLSFNQTVSCSTCHEQARAFSDGKRLSTGFAGASTTRNSMGLTNARWNWSGAFFWDQRATSLEQQVLIPITNPTEMGMPDVNQLAPRLAAQPFYPPLFTSAFGSPTINLERISKALAQFIRSIISTHSKYDAGQTSNFANFTPQEVLGRQVFNGQGRCSSCHSSDNFTTPRSATNNGLEFPYVDLGRGGVTGLTSDRGKFKAPSLRNIELTAPYMHDGRLATLEEVVEFYNSGIVFGPNLSPSLWNKESANTPIRLNLTSEQKAALVAFLKTLTDTSMTTDPKLSDPFNYGD